MTNTASNIIQELNELLKDSEFANESLVAENGQLKDMLIGVLLELNEFKDKRIAALEDDMFPEECCGGQGLH